MKYPAECPAAVLTCRCIYCVSHGLSGRAFDIAPEIIDETESGRVVAFVCRGCVIAYPPFSFHPLTPAALAVLAVVREASRG